MVALDGLLSKYDYARCHAMVVRGHRTTAEVAEIHGLSSNFSRLLVSVVDDWGAGDKEALARVSEEIYRDSKATPAARALSAEHASSCFKGDLRDRWSRSGLVLMAEMGSQDQRHLSSSTIFGLWDTGMHTVTPADVRRALDFLIDIEAYNAPGRIYWWGRMLEVFLSPEEAIKEEREWIEKLVARSKRDNAFRRDYLQNARQRLALLSVA